MRRNPDFSGTWIAPRRFEGVLARSISKGEKRCATFSKQNLRMSTVPAAAARSGGGVGGVVVTAATAVAAATAAAAAAAEPTVPRRGPAAVDEVEQAPRRRVFGALGIHGSEVNVPFESDAIETTSLAEPDKRIREEIWLLGQPPLADYLDYVEQRGRGRRRRWTAGRSSTPGARRTTTTTSSKAARRGSPTRSNACKLPKAMRPLAEQLSQHAHFRVTFDRLPTELRHGRARQDRRLAAARDASPSSRRCGRASIPRPDARGALPLLPAARARAIRR